MNVGVIRRVLSQRAGIGPDASAVANAALDVWLQIVSLLEPVLGAGGVDALFGRALNLAKATDPQLAAPGVHGNSASSLVSLQKALASGDAAVAFQGSHRLLETFVELLENLIGETLTASLLEPVWLSDTST